MVPTNETHYPILYQQLDAFGEDVKFELGVEHKAKLETRLRLLEEGNLRRLSGTGKAKAKLEKYHVKSEVLTYPAEADSTLPSTSKKRTHSETATPKKLIEEINEEDTEEVTSEKKKKKKNKKDKQALVEEAAEEEVVSPPKKKVKTEPAEVADEEDVDTTGGEKKKKKKKKNKQEKE